MLFLSKIKTMRFVILTVPAQWDNLPGQEPQHATCREKSHSQRKKIEKKIQQ